MYLILDVEPNASRHVTVLNLTRATEARALSIAKKVAQETASNSVPTSIVTLKQRAWTTERLNQWCKDHNVKRTEISYFKRIADLPARVR
jgi:hypothetical protein